MPPRKLLAFVVHGLCISPNDSMASIVFVLDDGSNLTLPLDAEFITVGRDPDSIAHLPNASVSSQHAIIRMREDGFYVQDLDSSNGTRVNGAVVEEAKLEDGDRVAFGDIQAVFYETDAPVAEVAPAPVPAPIPQPEVIVPLVTAAPPVTGLPHGRIVKPPRSVRSYRNEGGGCGTAIALTILFVGAFVIGLSLRHYKETNGGVLPNDLVTKLFSKVKIEYKADEKPGSAPAENK